VLIEKDYNEMIRDIAWKLDALAEVYEDMVIDEFADNDDMQQTTLNDRTEIKDNLTELYNTYMPSVDMKDSQGFKFTFFDPFEAYKFGECIVKKSVALVNYVIEVSKKGEATLYVRDVFSLFTSDVENAEACSRIC
jgi:hypothetical protein